MGFRKAGLAIALVVFTLGLAACGGGGADIESTTKTTTKGQELMDLQKAYEDGILTEEEYQKERKKILDSD